MQMDIPLKIGDLAWTIVSYKGKRVVRSGVVSELYFTQKMELAACVWHRKRGVIGKDVYLTEEEAKKELKRMENERLWGR